MPNINPARTEEETNEGGEVLFQQNFDKNWQHQLEEDIRKLIEAIAGYCTEMGTPDIVEAQAVGHIRAKISSSLYICDSLCRKYHEVKTKEKKEPDGKIVPAEYTPLYKCIMAFREELIGKYSLNGTNVTKRLEELMQLELAQIAVKHKLMDRLDSKEVWEEEVSKKFFLD